MEAEQDGTKERVAERIRGAADRYFEEVQAFRRHLHQHPELSFQEFATSSYIQEKLKERAILFSEGWVGTGLVGTIGQGDKVVGLRADIDALPIHERNECAYRSQNEGVMHACGHDVHSACLFGALLILQELEEELDGMVKFIFQPGEEQNPGGASRMIEEGVLEDPDVESMIGQHVYPDLDVGVVGFRGGPYMASTDEVRLRVRGKGGHAAMPEKNVDPVLIGSHIITALQQVVSRNADPTTPSVLSFGKALADGANNVIPDEMNFEGTFRTFDEEWRDEAHRRIQRVAEGTAQAMGGSCEVRIEKGYPYLVNDPAMTEEVKGFAEEFLGKEKVVDLPLRMTAEDFSYYSQKVPGTFYRLGVRNEASGINAGLHTPSFDIDEEALRTGMGLMAWNAYRSLQKKGG